MLVESLDNPGDDGDKGLKGTNSLPWVEKYRPNSLEELIAHEAIVEVLNRLIESNKLPHLLFHGPPGTGIAFRCWDYV